MKEETSTSVVVCVMFEAASWYICVCYVSKEWIDIPMYVLVELIKSAYLYV